MKKRLLAGVLVCLTVCLLMGSALGAGKVTGRAAATTTGTLGGLTWTLSGTTLTVSGTGGMPDCLPAALDPWPDTETEMKEWFAARSKATSVIISEGINKIGNYAFSGCTSLTTLSLPLELATVGSSAFSGCTRLTSAPLKYGVRTIGDSAFAGCSSLSSAVIPSTTTTIGANAFNGTGLKTLIIPSGVTNVGENAFENCSSLSVIHYCGGSYTNWQKVASTYLPKANMHYATQTVVEELQCDPLLPSRQILNVTNCGQCSGVAPQIEERKHITHTSETVPQQDPTCEAEGYLAYERCKKCGTRLSAYVPIDALGHEYSQEVIDTTKSYDATCIKTGLTIYTKTCTRCGETVQSRTVSIPLADHTKPKNSAQIKTETIPATCVKPETTITTYTCTVCKKEITETEEDPNGNTNPDAHNPGTPTYEIITPATCEKTGEQKVITTCKDCGTVSETQEPIPALNHLRPTKSDEIYVKVTKNPSCTEEGERQYIYQCQRPNCDGGDANHRIVETEKIPALGHTPVRVEAVPATCTKPGTLAGTKCSVCNDPLSGCVETEIDKTAHPEDKLETTETIDQPPTCTVAGSKTITVTCKDCKAEVSTETVEIPPSHKLDKTKTQTIPKSPETAPTCTTPGIGIIQYECEVCGNWIDGEETEMPALGGPHEFGDWTTNPEPTPTTPGLRQRTCRKCGYVEREVIPARHPAYTITLNPNGGTLPDGTAATMTTGTDGKLSAALPEPTREGYIFAGWFTAADDSGREVGKDTVFTEDTEIHARWTAEQIFTITLNAGGGTLDGQETKTVTTNGYGKLDTLPTPAREGFTFDGWYTAAAGGSQITAATVFQENTTIYAHWTEKQGYTITLDADGGTLSGSASVSTGADGRLSALPGAPTREGYDFDGWFTAKEGGVAVTTGTTFGSDSTIYAHWSVIDNTTAFAIRIGNVTGGVISASASTATRGTKVTVLADPDSGYALDSVSVTASGTTVEVTRESEVKYSFTMPGKAVDVTATFKSTGSGSGSGSGSGNNNSSSNNSGGAVWDTGTTTADPNPQPVPVKQSVPQLSAYGPQTFLDIPTNHWAAGEIAWAFQQGYMNGTGGGSFSPQAPITHSQLWTVLTRLLRYSNLSESNLLAIRSGLLDGGNPYGPATRQELVTALHRCAYLLGGARTPSVSINTYGDSSQVAGYARDAMAWAVTNGIISGTANGRLNPNGAVSRAQFAVILYRFTCRM